MENKSTATRHAEIKNLNELSNLENRCFLPAEACGREQMKQRLETYPDFFFIHEENGKIVSFADGFLSRNMDLKDEMYEDASMHDPDGTWFMILSADTDPQFRKHSFASGCLRTCMQQCKGEDRFGAVLTCIGFAGVGYEGMRTFAEHGIALGPEWCRKHYGGEILDVFLEYSLGKCRGEKFVYGCLKENMPSAHLACSREFVLCREDNLHFEKDDRNHPHLVFERYGKEYRS